MHELSEAVAFGAEQIFVRNEHIVERQLGRVLCRHADLLELPSTRKSRRAVRLEHQHRQPLAAGLRGRARDYRDQVGGLHIAYERLPRAEEHKAEIQSLMHLSYAVVRLKKKQNEKHRKIN